MAKVISAVQVSSTYIKNTNKKNMSYKIFNKRGKTFKLNIYTVIHGMQCFLKEFEKAFSPWI